MAEEKEKPVFDEQTLAKLLEAAFVLQEHSSELQDLKLELSAQRNQTQSRDQSKAEEPVGKSPAPELNTPEPKVVSPVDANLQTKTADGASTPTALNDTDYAATLAQVAEIQHQIEIRHLKLDEALSLITEQVIEICGAAGAAIGFVAGKTVHYRAVAGIRTLRSGATVTLERALCFPCLRTGEVFRCPDVDPQLLIDAEECRHRGIKSLIAVPVFRDNKIAGSLELYYSDPHAFTESDVHTCQLLAGVAAEALASGGDLIEESTTATDSTTNLDPIALLDQLSAQDAADHGKAEPPSVVCYKCGHKLVGQEQFCGQCGAARSAAEEPLSMQSKVASLWHLQQSKKKSAFPSQENLEPFGDNGSDENGSDHSVEGSLSKVIPATDSSNHRRDVRSLSAGLVVEAPDEFDRPLAESTDLPADDSGTEENLAQKTPPSADWSSAVSAREFLEQFAAGNRGGALVQFWNSRRGDIYLGLAVILVACVIRWGIWSNHTVNATPAPATPAATRHKVPAPPEVSILDRMLISMGLAEAPQPPEDKGNPTTQVWVDTHTGLYYCAGADLYGKTPKGKYTTQRDAQLDQFEPAYRKTCD